MPMKIMKLPAYWDAADAQLIINFIDELRDLLVDTYGDEIVELHRRLAQDNTVNESQTDLPFNDPVEF